MSNPEAMNTTSITELAELQAAMETAKDPLKAIEKKLAEEEMQAVIRLGKVLCLRLKLLGPDSDGSAEFWTERVLYALKQVQAQMQSEPSETKRHVVFNQLDDRLPEIMSGIFKVDPCSNPNSGHFQVELP